eukprot:jgi/Tetstr1/437868/TSEL_026508.t1
MANAVNIKKTIYAAQRVTAVVLLNYYHRLLADRGRGFHDPTRIPHDSFASAAQPEAACVALGVCKARHGAAGGWWTSGERAMQALVASCFEEAEDLVTQLEGAGQALAGSAPGYSSAAVHHAPVRPPRDTSGNGNGPSNGKAWAGDAPL